MIEAVAVAILVLGMMLFKRGRWPARVGTTPHCSGCNYPLTGIRSERCPGGGRPTPPGDGGYGERHRKSGLTILGLLLILLPVIALAVRFSGVMQNVDWYHYR